MARPRRHNADYFPHDCKARHDLKIKVLERKMGLAGYAMHFKVQEILGAHDYYEVDYSQPYIKESLLSEIECTEEQWEQYLEISLDLGLLKKKRNKLFSPGLKESLKVLDRKRELSRKDKSHKNNKLPLPDSEGFLNQKPPRNSPKTPSKAKQRKAEESKEKESTAKNGNGAPALFSSENSLPKNTRELLTAPPFELTPEQAAGLQDKYEDHYLREHIDSVLWRMKQPNDNIKNPIAYLLDRLEKNYPKPGRLIEEEKARRIKQQQEGEMKQREQEAQKVENELNAEREESARLMQFLEQSPPDVKKLINGWVYKRAQTEEPRLMEYAEVILNYQDEADLEKIDPKYRMTLKVFIKEAVKEYLNQQDSPLMKDES